MGSVGCLRDLDLAFNPYAVIDDPDECKIPVPTIGEIWRQIVEAPGAVWKNMKNLNIDLPEVDFNGTIETVISWGDGLVIWIIGE